MGVGITIPPESVITAAKSARIVYVSPLNGSDVSGNGTLYKPYATIQEAVDNARNDDEVGGDVARIYVDGPVPTVFTYPVDVPVDTFISISSPLGGNNPFISIELTLRSGSSVYLDNISVESVTYIPGAGTSEMWVEHGFIEDSISGVATNLTVSLFGTSMTATAVASFEAAGATMRGTVESAVVLFDVGNLNGGWFNGKRIQAVADPVDTQDAATKNYVNHRAVRTETSGPYTAVADDAVILADTTSGAFTIILPTAVGITGKVYNIKKINAGGGLLTIDPDGTETIDGNSAPTISAQWTNFTIVSDGTNWLIL